MYIEIKNNYEENKNIKIFQEQDEIIQKNYKIVRDKIIRILNENNDDYFLIIYINACINNQISSEFIYGDLNKNINNTKNGMIIIDNNSIIGFTTFPELSLSNNKIGHNYYPDYNIPFYLLNNKEYDVIKTTPFEPYNDTITKTNTPLPYYGYTTSDFNNPTTGTIFKPSNISTDIKNIHIPKNIKIQDPTRVDNTTAIFDGKNNIVDENILNLDERKRFQSEFMNTINKKHKEEL